MGKSKSNPYLSRRQNKQRKEEQNYRNSKKVRSLKRAEKNQREGNLQQQVFPHKKALLTARLLQLKAQREREAGGDGAAPRPTRQSKPLSPAAPPAARAPAAAPADHPQLGDANAPPPQPDYPGAERWRVAATGCVVRQAETLTSPVVGRLPRDAVFWLVEKVGRRGRIVSPTQGWLSLTDSQGCTICDEAPAGADDDSWEGGGGPVDDGGEGDGDDDGDDAVGNDAEADEAPRSGGKRRRGAGGATSRGGKRRRKRH